MLNCEVCSQRQNLLFTKCCKAIICQACTDRQDKKFNCHCGRFLAQGIRNYSQHPQLVQIFSLFQQGNAKECDRCDNACEVQCVECNMLYCPSCNIEIHGALGFAKHTRKLVQQSTAAQRIRTKEMLCLLHGQILNSGCDCGTALCSSCLKSHKQICSKYRLRLFKQFKDDYCLNVLLRMRQLTFYKQRLSEDKTKFMSHFKSQESQFKQSQKVIKEQFDFLKKMIEIKQNEIEMKMSQYWDQCSLSYKHTLQNIQKQLRTYDHYAQLLEKFSQHLLNLDFFEKRIKRYTVNFQYVNCRGLNFQQTQSSIMGLGIQEKQWETQSLDILGVDNGKDCLVREDLKVMSTLQNTSELIIDYGNQPLKDRQITLVPSHSEIFFTFIHLPYQNVNYQVEYGVGMRIKGQEIFKRVTNNNGYGVIEGLNPNTKYRVRMRVIDGKWGNISQIMTLDIPRFNPLSSSFAKTVNQNTVQLGKGGTIYGSNQINFGVHRWVIKLTSKTISYEDSQTACLTLGISNKDGKKAVFVGSTLNYGFQKKQIILRVLLDCNEKKLVIADCTSNKQQVYQNLPNYPLFPTITNKGNGQIMVRYSLTTDEINTF